MRHSGTKPKEELARKESDGALVDDEDIYNSGGLDKFDSRGGPDADERGAPSRKEKEKRLKEKQGTASGSLRGLEGTKSTEGVNAFWIDPFFSPTTVEKITMTRTPTLDAPQKTPDDGLNEHNIIADKKPPKSPSKPSKDAEGKQGQKQPQKKEEDVVQISPRGGKISKGQKGKPLSPRALEPPADADPKQEMPFSTPQFGFYKNITSFSTPQFGFCKNVYVLSFQHATIRFL